MNNNIPFHQAIWMYGLVSFFLFFEMAVQVSPSVMANQLMSDLNLTPLGLGLMSGFYFYTYTAMQIPTGMLFDRYKPTLIITLAIIICALGAFAFAVSSGILLGSLARLLMGLGSAFAFVAVLIVSADLFDNRYFALMAGITQALAALGAMAGQWPIHALVVFFGWRMTMVSLAGIGLVLAIFIFSFLRYERFKKDELKNSNEPHSAATNKASQSSEVIAKISCAHLKNLFVCRQTWLTAIYACLMWAPMSGFASLWGVPFLIHAQMLDGHFAALICSVMWLGLAVGSPLLGIFAEVIDNKRLALCLSALLGVLFFTPIILWHLQKWQLVTCLFLAGFACSGQALSFAVVKEKNPEHMRGTALAFNNMAVVISGALFQPLIGKFISFHSAISLALQYHHALFSLIFVYMISFVISLFII